MCIRDSPGAVPAWQDIAGGRQLSLGDDVVLTDSACAPGGGGLDCTVVGLHGVIVRIRGDQATVTRPVLPAAAARTDIRSVAYVAGRPVVATTAGLFRERADGTWARDEKLGALMARAGAGTRVDRVAALADGGVVADGRWASDDGTTWRASAAPLDRHITALAAYRDASGAVRALAVAGPTAIPDPPALNPADPNQRTDPTPDDGVLMRETADGWVDVENSAFPDSPGADQPQSPGGYRALAVDAAGTGWALGGRAMPTDFDDYDGNPGNTATWLVKGALGAFTGPDATQRDPGLADPDTAVPGPLPAGARRPGRTPAYGATQYGAPSPGAGGAPAQAPPQSLSLIHISEPTRPY